MISTSFETSGWWQRWSLMILLCVVFVPAAVQGQEAAISGTVRDSSGAVLPEATIVLHNTATNLDRTTQTNSVGFYSIPQIPPGNYTIRAGKEGFASIVNSNFPLVVNQRATLDFTLKTGSVSESVTVQANAVALETASSELGVAVIKQQVNDLPLNGRNFTQLLNLTPGISTINVSQNASTGGGIWSNPVGTFSYPSVNGQTNRSNLFLLDGVNDEGAFGTTYAVAPIVDEIQEFKVQSHNDDASYGGVVGGVINVVTKSGTTELHGSAWEFVRNTQFDARNPFLPKVTPFQQNQFGATLGGPLWIPGERDKKRTFFFLGYEGFRNHTAAQNLYHTPTATELSGDLSNGQPSTLANRIYNPFNQDQPFFCDPTGNPLPANAQGVQPTGAPCNKIPLSMINPLTLTYAKLLFPQPNFTTNGFFNGLDTTKTITRQDEFSARLDHQLSVHDNLWARWSQFRQPVKGSGGFTGLIHNQITAGYNVGVHGTHVFSPSSLLEWQFGRTDVSIDQGTNYAGQPPSIGTSLGFNPNFAGSFIGGVSMIPDMVISGLQLGSSNPSNHGAAQVDDTHVSNIWEWGGNYSKVYRQHTFSMGGNFASNNAGALYLNSSLIFTAANTQTFNPANAGGFPGGSSLASFLLGIPNVINRRNVIETEHGGWVDGFFFMDQWKATNKLTVNLGLRYDLTLMPIYGDKSHQNNFVGDMNFRDGTYILAAVPPSCAVTNAAPCIPGGTLPANVVPTRLGNGAIFHNDYSNWQPRVGFAYQLMPATVVRGGFGLFFDNWAAIVQTAQNYEGAWPSIGQVQNSNQNALTGCDTPPCAPQIFAANPLVNGVLPGPTPFNNNGDWYADPFLKRPYSEQFNLGVQQQLGSSTVLTVNYVGAAGRRLDVGGAYNVATTPGGSRPFSYIDPVNWDRSVGRSSYNSLQMTLNGRSYHGLTYLISYTWSKTLDIGCSGWYGVEGCSTQQPYNLNADRGPAAFDLPQNLTASWVYELPFGKGRKHATGNALLDYVVGGWSLNGTLSRTSGQPFDVGISGDIAQTGNFNFGNACGCYERLNLNGSPYPSNQSPRQWLNVPAFSSPASRTYGNLGRDSLRGDSFKNLDLALFKLFPITERKSLEFRFEMFNATNTPVWGLPDANYSNFVQLANAPPGTPDPNLNHFGVVSSTANTARQLQFGLKFYF